MNIKMQRVGIKPIVIVAGLLLLLIGCTTDENLGPTDARDKYLGVWGCAETGSSSSTFNVTITKNTVDSTRIFIAGFNNQGSGFKPYAVVNGNSLNIPSQNLSGLTVAGNGTYSAASGKINLTYSVNDGTGAENYTAVLSK